MSMDKWQAIHDFWSGFGIPAYDENSVPDDAVMPYITYEAEIGAIDALVNLTASVWYKSMSWSEISRKALQIGLAINGNGNGCYLKKIDGGYMLLSQGSPFAQRLDSGDDRIRRIYFNIQAEFLTAN